MAAFVYQVAKALLFNGGIDLDAADIRVALMMSNTTADTEDDANTFAGFTTLDECDGASYARADLTGLLVTRDDPSSKVFLDANDAAFATLGAGTRSNVGALIHVHDAVPGDEVPLFWQDGGGFPFSGTGATVTVQWAATGIVRN